ncbi:phospholipid-transporting ATPase ABCA3 isoform X2 [Hydra vulgaris]|uniref:phospholipid-transporting ATPase ABCA3 isoform X2 n=1 Tax=Hydra vulgaris TaxID=6087 RepID=UPI001F5EEE6F|nr:phospholipid-transporting ATPase ABCA3 isoform X2 [Hydra vulgaris]
MSWFRDFRLLSWKNFLLQKRRPVSTAFEIFLPLFFMAILLTLRVTVIKQNEDVEYRWPGFSITNQIPVDRNKKWTIAFAPNNTRYFSIMSNLRLYLDVLTIPFNTEKDLTDAVVTDLDKEVLNQKFLCGVIFDETSRKKDFKYRLRFPSNSRKRMNIPGIIPQTWYTQFVFPFSFQGLGPRTSNSIYGGPPDYFSEGFLSVQRAIDLAIIKNQNNSFNIKNFGISMRRFPYPKKLRDPFVIVIQGTLPLLLMLSLVYTALSNVKNIVHEKEHKLKESMKMMGLRNWIHWLAWFTKCFVFLLIPMILISIVMCVDFGGGKMLTKSNGVIIFIFLMMYSISSIMFCFFVSTLFSKANTAAAAGGILWFLLYVPYWFLFQSYDTISTKTKIFSCVDFQLAMALGSNLIGQFEGQESGLQWYNINKGVTIDTTFTFLQVLLMFLVDIVLYGLLTWYIEAVFPGEYGIPQKWNFFLTKSYWFGYQFDITDFHPIKHNNEFIEKYPEGLNPGISIRNLSKEFKTERGKKVAVDDLSLNLYAGEITAFLGHNGAGKTTTISMLTGLIPPSTGTAIINNYNILKDIGSVRKSLGICPQHNVLFDHLTVEEHLWFFTSLKGVDDKNLITEEVNRMIDLVGLADKRKSKPNSLSGGMKRKLSVGIALVGNSKIVILDEPTSGMDVSARRFTWDLLQKERKGRTILLTTHYMDEADVLGDRIAIMANGKLQCYGSSLFLKKKYGVGYHMIMVKNACCNVEKVTQLISKHIPTASLENNVGMELSFILPSDYVSVFESLFSEIENRHEELGISSYGASITTLEEVFLKVCENAEEMQNVDQNIKKEIDSNFSLNLPDLLPDVLPLSNSQSMQLLDPPSLTSQKNSGWTLSIQRWYAMFLKRFLQSKRYKAALISQLIVPSINVMLALIVVKTMPKAVDSPPRLLDLNMFGSSNVILHGESSSIFDISIYEEFIKSKHSVPERANMNMVDYLLMLETKFGLGEFNLNYLIGLELNYTNKEVSATMWYNNEALHAAPVSLNAFTNSLLRMYDPECSISSINDPLPKTVKQSISDLSFNPNGFQIGFSLVFSMAFLASSFIVFLVQEKASGSKHVQFVSGVDPFSYWSSAYTWDLINFILPIVLIVVLFEIFQQEAFIGVRLGYVVLLLVFYGLAVIPFMYLFSFLFVVASTAFTRMTILNVITGLATLLVVNILSLPSLNLLDVANILKWVFLVLPNYCLGQGIIDIFNNYQYNTIFDKALQMCIDELRKQLPFLPSPKIKELCLTFTKEMFANQSVTFQTNYLSWYNPGIGRSLVFMVIQAVIFFALVLFIEYRVLKRFISVIKSRFLNRNQEKHLVQPGIQLDEDVLMEQIRVEQGDISNCVLKLNGLTKVYGSKFGEEFLAVDNISLGIQYGECFGLIGQNGAGKTSTFKMLTGDETITSGMAFIDKYNIATEMAQVRQKIGYCPQFDSLNDLMTGREHLEMYCRLRGVPEKNIPYLVDFLAKSLSVDQHIDKVTKAYSGGNKRKLCTAIALAGDPPLIFLDEPSSGMDPAARRMLWNSLFHVLKSGKSIVITSHLMEECEALCTRLAIMVNGQFKCIGSPQHLKNRFGEGYTLIARVGGVCPETTSLKRFIETKFPGSLLKDEHQGYLHYQLTNKNISWANLFGVMERAKVDFEIEDYSVSQTTLEQIFLNFTRFQRSADE